MIRTQDYCIHSIEDSALRLIALGNEDDITQLEFLRDTVLENFDEDTAKAMVAIYDALINGIIASGEYFARLERAGRANRENKEYPHNAQG